MARLVEQRFHLPLGRAAQLVDRPHPFDEKLAMLPAPFAIVGNGLGPLEPVVFSGDGNRLRLHTMLPIDGWSHPTVKLIM